MNYGLCFTAAWLGHSTLVAQKHYWQVTEADFNRASRGGAKSGALAAQNPAQQAHALNRTDSHEEGATPYEQDAFAISCDTQLVGAKKMAEVHGNRTHRPQGLLTAQRF